MCVSRRTCASRSMRVRAPLCWWTLRRLTHDELVQHLSTIADWGYLYSYIIGSRRARRFAMPRKVRRATCGPPTARGPSLSWRRPLSSRFALFEWRRGAGVGRHGHCHHQWRDFCCQHADCLGSTTLNGATSNPGTFGLGNEATDFVTTTGSTVLLMP